MEQCLSLITDYQPAFETTNMAPHILYTKESTHTAYQLHHRYILYHTVTYDSTSDNRSLQTITGNLHYVDDMGYVIPCSFIPITILVSDNSSFKITHTDCEGNYKLIYDIDYKSSHIIEQIMVSSNLKLFSYLPTIRIHFPLDTIIDDWDNLLIETPYVD